MVDPVNTVLFLWNSFGIFSSYWSLCFGVSSINDYIHEATNYIHVMLEILEIPVYYTMIFGHYRNSVWLWTSYIQMPYKDKTHEDICGPTQMFQSSVGWFWATLSFWIRHSSVLSIFQIILKEENGICPEFYRLDAA
jgi:hypothetical protein